MFIFNYIIIVILSILLLYLLRKLDKKYVEKYDGHIKEGIYYSWIETYNGREKIYKILFIISLIPYVNNVLSMLLLILAFGMWLNLQLTNLNIFK